MVSTTKISQFAFTDPQRSFERHETEMNKGNLSTRFARLRELSAMSAGDPPLSVNLPQSRHVGARTGAFGLAVRTPN